MRRLLLLAAVVLLSLSCAPPFNTDLNGAATLIASMTPEGRVGPINFYEGAFSTPVFYPEKTATGVDATRGFYYCSDAASSYGALGFVAPNGFGGWTTFASPVASLYQQDTSYPVAVISPAKAGDNAGVLSFNTLRPDTSFAMVEQVTGTGFSQVGFTQFSGLTGTYGTAPQALGASVFPTAGASDTIYLLVLDASTTGQYYEGRSDLVSAWPGPTSFSAFATATLDFLAGTNRVTYFHNPVTGESYASFHTAAGWQCWKWWYDTGGFHETRLAGVTARIDALLTTGRLFSAQDGKGRVYDSGGAELTSFPLGGLAFAFEEYVNGTPRVFFSLPVRQDNDHLFFTIYSIASWQLEQVRY